MAGYKFSLLNNVITLTSSSRCNLPPKCNRRHTCQDDCDSPKHVHSKHEPPSAVTEQCMRRNISIQVRIESIKIM